VDGRDEPGHDRVWDDHHRYLQSPNRTAITRPIQFVVAGLVPAIHVFQNVRMRQGYVYFLTNQPNGILYVGVTSNLAKRIHEHRTGAADGFTKQYGLKRLVYFEIFDDIQTAIQREHNIKHWSRTWKVRLILANNPDWKDLYDSILS
jgi:putative endonuclease